MRTGSLTVLLSVLLAAATTAVAYPTDKSNISPAVDKRGIPAWQFYYGVDSAQHQTNFNEWIAAGYRMISLSAYGQPPNNLYAAIWVQRPGVAWQAIHEASGESYQAWFDTQNAAGYVSTIITATGSGSGAIFAGVMEKISVSGWYQKCDLTTEQYEAELNNAQTNRYILKSFTEYGSASNRQYCGIWHANPVFDKYSTWVDESYSDYQLTFNSETTKPLWRPYYVTVSEDHLITSAFTDTDVASWVARHGMTASDLQAEYETQKAAGRYLINLQGGGTGTDAQYTGIWAEQDIPTPRTWRVTGTVTGFTNNAAALSQSDSMMQTFMQTNGVRQAQLSVGKNGVIVMERAYSWSESTRHTTDPSDVFLLASNSKMFVEAAVQLLYDKGKLTSSTQVYPFLGYTNPNDKRLNNITVQQLLDHYGGLDVSISGFDAAYSMREIALAQSSGARPATVKDIVDYMFKQPLQHNPGDQYAYSNYGYILLSYVVQVATGESSYWDYLNSAILQPGNYDVRQWVTEPSAHVNDPITQESVHTGPSALQPLSPNPVADIFGGDGMYKESDFGGCNLATSASTLVKFIHTHAVWGNGGRTFSCGGGPPESCGREGSTPGTETFAESRSDDLDWAVVVNTRDWPALPALPQGSDPFSVFFQNTVPGFLGSNPTA